jgi:predicted O-methyltransferase YrrM
MRNYLDLIEDLKLERATVMAWRHGSEMVNYKVWRLLALASTSPIEFCDRVMTAFEGRWDQLRPRPQYQSIQPNQLTAALERVLGTDIQALLQEPALAEIDGQVRMASEQLIAHAPFVPEHNSDVALARLCYVVCRVVKPTIALETGVAYGVTSAFILKALEVNGIGELYSIDLPPLGRDADRYVGAFVPEGLKRRWKLLRGRTRRVLNGTVRSLPEVGLFVHDSLHTYRNTLWELNSIATRLARPAIVIADDIELNAAFQEWSKDKKPNYSAAVQTQLKKNLFGVAAFT